ncbi:MAG: GAF domain-containing sensor histidine kinase [Anaerolineae bacterium]|nr:GAF domain-containing sensor histidine kinase [Anaerolineae bacterium]
MIHILRVLSPTTDAQHYKLVGALRWAAFASWAVMMLANAGMLVLISLNHLPPIRLFSEFILQVIAGSLALGSVGLLIALHRPRNSIGWLFCIAGASLSLSGVLEQYIRYALVTRPGVLPFTRLAAWVNFWLFIPIIFSILIFVPLLFPDGRLPSRRWRPVLGIAGLAVLTMTVSAAFQAGPVDASLPEVHNPIAPAELQPLVNAVSNVGMLLTLVSLGAAVAAPVVRLRRAQGVERQQVKWFVYGALILIASFVSPIALAWPNFTGDTTLSGITLAIGFTVMPVTVGIAILRHRLYDIDVILQRTLLYGALTLSIIGIYVFVVGYLGFIFGVSGNLAISLTATGLVAVLFQPLRERLQRIINRLIYGERREPYAVLSQLGQRLEAALAPGEVLRTVVTTVKDALKLPYAAVTLEHDGDFAIAAAEGTPTADPLHVPLSYQGKVIGELLVSSPTPDENWTDAERRLLDDLTHHAGVAVHGVRLMAELQHARERLVLAREEERRRLRRGLHDELAPSLAAFALTAAAASQLIATNPQAAAEAMTKLHRSIREAIADLRRLVYDLRPPTLDELGFVESVRELADRCQPGYDAQDQSSVAITLDVTDLPAVLPAAVEVAAYRIIQEALRNVIRHARACACRIQLACTDDHMLSLSVTDDGVGLPPGSSPGVGMSNMRERAAELGGYCRIERVEPSGTRVTAALPIAAHY